MMPFAAMRLRTATAGRLWLPSDVTGLRGWWVADNPANTLVSGFLNTVADKSPTVNTLQPYQAVAGNEATLVTGVLNGRTIWRGDSVSKKAAFVMADNAITNNTAGVTLAMLYRSGPAGGMADQSVIRVHVSGTNAARAMIGRGSYASNAVYAGGRRLDADTYDGLNDNTDFSTNWLILVASLNYAAATMVMSINGTAATDPTFQTAGNTSATNSINSNVGHSGAGTGNAYGDYAEGCIYRGALGTSDRQKLEGYIAWQWGLTSSLPIGHPYKAAAPTI